MSDKKRVFCLYRVSTTGQLDKNTLANEKDDIPMQKRACEDFCKRMGWEIVDSRSEKGVSGYKVSANDRDAIIDIREAASKKEFDILLVYMFDRLGRKEDETPFIVQWFINSGIEVWSTQEGQQKIEQHVDKLLNYIRYWQAQGESEKTSARVKTAQAQMIQDGHFRGGTVPFGYELQHNGRTNKKGFPIGDLAVHKQEAAVVKTIFDRYVNHGYGTHRICNYLAENGMATKNGSRFINTTIQNILKRQIYIGILSGGGVQSDIIPALQIISPDVFERAQEIMKERSADYADRRVPLNTKGNALLSGNVFCGHCDGRLTITTNGKKYIRKDGEVTITPKTRYVCYNKTRHPERCDGQTGYTTSKLDGVVEKIVESIFSKIKEQPGEQIIQAEFDERIAGIKLNLEQAKVALSKDAQVLSMLEDELFKILQGTSSLKPELLNKKHDEAERAVNQRKVIVEAFERELENSKETMSQVKRQYNDVMTWADMYSESPIDAKKMIVAQLISAVRVSKDYKIEIDFKISERQLGLAQEMEVTKKSKQRKGRNEPSL
ncbi:MAG: recombinase family protein [Streptococcaceae bacterium]|nr:recombinase family protein [Streptococcaceae bacterium]